MGIDGLLDLEAVEALRPGEALSVPAEVPLDLHGPRIVHPTGETGLFVQLPPGRLRLGLPGLDAATGRLPQDLAVPRVPPPKQEDPPPPIEADDASGAPVERLIHPVKVGGAPGWPGRQPDE